MDRWVITDLWPMGARRLFPCWDEPIFQSSFNIIIKHPKNYKIWSNMAKIREERTSKQSDIIETHFEETFLIPTYHVSAMIALKEFSVQKEDITMLYRKELDFSNIIFVLDVLNTFTVCYAQWKCSHELFEKRQLRHVVIPGFRHDTISNLGFTFYR